MDRGNYLSSIPDIQQLFKAVFHRGLSASFLQWRFADNLMSLSPVTLMREKGQLVAHSASTPNQFHFNERNMLGGMNSTAMTHPSYQGQGLFRKLTLENEAELIRLGFDFLYCFPNRNSAPIFLQMGWVAVYEIPTLHLILIDADQNIIPPSEPLFDNEFELYDYDTIAAQSGLICIPRTRRWLQWRYVRNPLNEYKNLVVVHDGELRAFAVMKIYHAEGKSNIDLVDYFSKDIVSLQLLIDQLKAYAAGQKKTGISTWAPHHHFSHHVFMRRGFLHQGPVTYFLVKPLKDNYRDSLKCYSNWWVTMGDSDIY